MGSVSVHESTTYRSVPECIREIFEEDVLQSYLVSGSFSNFVCLDENILNQMTFTLLSVIHFEETGELIDDSLLNDPYEWEHLNERYSITEYEGVYLLFREDVRMLLDNQQMAFQEHWVYSGVSEDYLCQTNNNPLQSVW